MERLALDEFDPMAHHPAIISHIRYCIRKLAGEDGTVLVVAYSTRLTEAQIAAISQGWDPAKFRFPRRYH